MTSNEKAAWRDPALGTERELDVQGAGLRCFEAGHGPPIVFVHGLLVNANLWRKVVAKLSPDFRCIVLDMPLGSHTVPMPENADLSMNALTDLIAGSRPRPRGRDARGQSMRASTDVASRLVELVHSGSKLAASRDACIVAQSDSVFGAVGSVFARLPMSAGTEVEQEGWNQQPRPAYPASPPPSSCRCLCWRVRPGRFSHGSPPRWTPSAWITSRCSRRWTCAPPCSWPSGQPVAFPRPPGAGAAGLLVAYGALVVVVPDALPTMA